MTLERELPNLYRDWFAAIAAHDRGWFERRLAPDFRYVTFEGGVWDRSRLIEVNMSVTDTELSLLECAAREIAADVALVLGRYRVRAFERYADEAMTGFMRAALREGVELRWSGLWRRDADGWRAFLHHVTQVVEERL